MIYINIYNDDCKENTERVALHRSKNGAIRGACEQFKKWFWHARAGYIKTQVFHCDTFEFVEEFDLSNDIDSLCDEFNENLEPFGGTNETTAYNYQSA